MTSPHRGEVEPTSAIDTRDACAVDLRSGSRTHSPLAVPVWSADRRRVIAIIRVLNKRTGTFDLQDRMSLERIPGAVARTVQQIAPDQT